MQPGLSGKMATSGDTEDQARLLESGEVDREELEDQARLAREDLAHRTNLAEALRHLLQGLREDNVEMTKEQIDQIETCEESLQVADQALNHTDLAEVDRVVQGLLREMPPKDLESAVGGSVASASQGLLASPTRESRRDDGVVDSALADGSLQITVSSDEDETDEDESIMMVVPSSSTPEGAAYYAAVKIERDQAAAELLAVTYDASNVKMETGSTERKLTGKQASAVIPRFPFGDVRDAVEKELLFPQAAEVRVCPCGHVVPKRADFLRHFVGCMLGVRWPCPVYDCAHLATRANDLVKHVEKSHPGYSAQTDNEITKDHMKMGAFQPTECGCMTPISSETPERLVYYSYHLMLRAAVARGKWLDPLTKTEIVDLAKDWPAKFAAGPAPPGGFPDDRLMSLPPWSPGDQDAPQSYEPDGPVRMARIPGVTTGLSMDPEGQPPPDAPSPTSSATTSSTMTLALSVPALARIAMTRAMDGEGHVVESTLSVGGSPSVEENMDTGELGEDDVLVIDVPQPQPLVLIVDDSLDGSVSTLSIQGTSSAQAVAPADIDDGRDFDAMSISNQVWGDSEQAEDATQSGSERETAGSGQNTGASSGNDTAGAPTKQVARVADNSSRGHTTSYAAGSSTGKSRRRGNRGGVGRYKPPKSGGNLVHGKRPGNLRTGSSHADVRISAATQAAGGAVAAAPSGAPGDDDDETMSMPAAVQSEDYDKRLRMVVQLITVMRQADLNTTASRHGTPEQQGVYDALSQQHGVEVVDEAFTEVVRRENAKAARDRSTPSKKSKGNTSGSSGGASTVASNPQASMAPPVAPPVAAGRSARVDSRPGRSPTKRASPSTHSRDSSEVPGGKRVKKHPSRKARYGGRLALYKSTQESYVWNYGVSTEENHRLETQFHRDLERNSAALLHGVAARVHDITGRPLQIPPLQQSPVEAARTGQPAPVNPHVVLKPQKKPLSHHARAKQTPRSVEGTSGGQTRSQSSGAKDSGGRSTPPAKPSNTRSGTTYAATLSSQPSGSGVTVSHQQRLIAEQKQRESIKSQPGHQPPPVGSMAPMTSKPTALGSSVGDTGPKAPKAAASAPAPGGETTMSLTELDQIARSNVDQNTQLKEGRDRDAARAREEREAERQRRNDADAQQATDQREEVRRKERDDRRQLQQDNEMRDQAVAGDREEFFDPGTGRQWFGESQPERRPGRQLPARDQPPRRSRSRTPSVDGQRPDNRQAPSRSRKPIAGAPPRSAFFAPKLALETIPRPVDLAAEVDTAISLGWTENQQIAFFLNGRWHTVYAAHPGRLTGWTSHATRDGICNAGVEEHSLRREPSQHMPGPVAVTPMSVPDMKGRPGPSDEERRRQNETVRRQGEADQQRRHLAAVQQKQLALVKQQMKDRAARVNEDLREQELKELEGLRAEHNVTRQHLDQFQCGSARDLQPAEFVLKDIPVDGPLSPSQVVHLLPPSFPPPTLPALLVNPPPVFGATASAQPTHGATTPETLPVQGATAASASLHTPSPRARGQVSMTLREPPTVQRQRASPAAVTENMEVSEPAPEDDKSV